MSSIFDRFELASFKRMLNNAKMVHKYSKKPTLWILLDMAKCILVDHVGYMEYNLFGFVNKNKAQRDTYVTFDYSQNLFKTLNNAEDVEIFNDKLAFNKVFKDYLQRDFIDIGNSSYDEFVSFCKNKKLIFAKPADSCSGKGIYQSYVIDDNTDLKQLYDFFKENKLFVEDCIVQHPKMNSLNPSSINTVRICTLVKDDKAYFMYAILRIGLASMKVDNVGAGGIYTLLFEDGKIVKPCWSDKTITAYTNHPSSGMNLIGFEVPYFKQAVDLCLKAALVNKNVRYVGWDIAISENGPVIVEGNPLPGYDMPQNHFVSSKDTGLKPEFEKILNTDN